MAAGEKQIAHFHRENAQLCNLLVRRFPRTTYALSPMSAYAAVPLPFHRGRGQMFISGYGPFNNAYVLIGQLEIELIHNETVDSDYADEQRNRHRRRPPDVRHNRMQIVSVGLRVPRDELDMIQEPGRIIKNVIMNANKSRIRGLGPRRGPGERMEARWPKLGIGWPG